MKQNTENVQIQIMYHSNSRKKWNNYSQWRNYFDLPSDIVLVPQLTSKVQDKDEDYIVCLSEVEDNFAEDNTREWGWSS